MPALSSPATPPPTPPPGKRLIASIHDVGPRFENQVVRLADLLSDHLGGPRFAMLVVPDHWGESPLAGNSAFAARLREWSDAGIEMFVHGWFHKDLAQHSGMAAFKARHMTASEGEFLGLDEAEAARRMADGRALVEDIIGRPAAGFVAPAWLYGPGARAALGKSGFALAEDHMRVWRPATGEVVSRGPVITWASRSTARTASSLAFAALARNTLHPLRDIRVAVHPGDVTKLSIVESIGRTLAAFAARRAVGRYRDLLA
ncbi:MAG: polysaccharide deacetylase family protein [Rhodobacteraceae bacterium]|nr:polysaccharide deacetylase family protein [Paracoccaceae bacterium]